MSEATLNIHDQYLADLAREPVNGQPDWVGLVRKTGRAAFEASEFPHTRLEEWRHTNIAAISNNHFSASLEPGRVDASQLAGLSLAGDGYHELVFVDGQFSADLSTIGELPEGATLGGLYANLGSEIARAHVNQYVQNRNAYTALNTASLKDGALVYLPRKVVLDAPVHLLFVTTTGDQRAAHVRNVIALDECSEATIISTYAGLGAANYLNNIVEEVALGPNSSLKYYKAVQEGGAGNHLSTTEFHQDRDSRLFSLVVSQEGKITRNQQCIRLAGPGAECALHGLYMNDGERLIDNALHIHHNVPNCNSRIAYKGILDGNSKSVFTGKVNVDQAAQKTDSDQLSNNLLLSDSATIDTKPQLEIYADDVKCTHGATVGAHPDPIIFYFRSRGIDEATARGMLTYGFADEIVAEIGPDAFRDRLQHYIFKKYSPQQ
jgi:Fe-S cluster assembly protein SufD